MDDLLLHPETRREMAQFTARPSHALMFTGPEGAGKYTIAAGVLSTVMGIEAKALDTYPYFLHAQPVNSSLSVETIRSLHEFLRLRTTGIGALRRAVLVENAHTLTVEAQNAFLKMLEEPPDDTIIVLTVVGEHSLLPTIYSRVQKIAVKPATKAMLHDYFSKKYPASAIEKAYYISDGQVGLMTALLDQDESHALVTSISQAKQVLSSTIFDRLCLVESLSKQKDAVPTLLYALERICHAALVLAAENNKQQDVVRWHGSLKKLAWCQEQLRHNAQTKLLLTDLMLSI